MDDELLKIYSLMKTAEDQLAALRQAIADLMAERDALAQERAALHEILTGQADGLKAAAATLKAVGGGIREDVRQATPALQNAVRGAVDVSMRETLGYASKTAINALQAASAPFLTRLDTVTQAARAAEASLENAGRWFAWKWIALAGALSAGLLLMAYGVLTVLDNSHEAALVRRQQTLTQDIARLQNAADALEKRTYGLHVVSGSDGVFLVTPKGVQPTQCKAGPCIRLE